MATQAAELAGADWGEAFRHILAEHDATIGRAAAPAPAPERDRLGAHLTEQGEVYVWPENQPAAAMWLLIGWSAWDTGWDGSWQTLRVGLVLEFARQMAAEDDTLRVLPLVQQAQVIAGTVAPLQRERVAEQRRRQEAQDRLTKGRR